MVLFNEKQMNKHGLPFFILFHPLSKIIMNLSTTHDKDNFLKEKITKSKTISISVT